MVILETLDVGQANELKLAFRRNGWTPPDIKRLGEGDLLSKILLVIRGEAEITPAPRRWELKEGVIYFTVKSNGRTGEQWIAYFEEKGFSLGSYVKSILRSPDFKPTNGITYRIAMIPGSFWKKDGERITKNIRQEAANPNRGWTTPNAEITCLIRDMFTNKEIEEMGLYWIVTMHESIKDSVGGPSLLSTCRGRYGLNAYFDRPGGRWDSLSGFAFALPQVS